MKMHPLHKLTTIFSVAGLLLLCACSDSSNKTRAGLGGVNLVVTDAPSDDWQEITVSLKSISLRVQDTRELKEIWTASDTSSASINLVDLDGVGELLGKVTIDQGVYDRLVLTIDADPSTITMVNANGTTIPTANIEVAGASNGTVNVPVDLNPKLTVTADATNLLLIDFDLAHPAFIQEIGDPTQSGLGKIVLSFQIHHKPYSASDWLQFRRSFGTVTTLSSTALEITTIRGKDLTFSLTANSLYFDVDTTKTWSSSAGTLKVGDNVMVDSNMNADGSLFARRIWHTAQAMSTLFDYNHEGIVWAVDNNGIQKRILVSEKNQQQGRWHLVWVNITNDTTFTFRDTTTMGIGPSYLQYLWRGFRVNVDLVDATAAIKVAKTVNIQQAHDEGKVNTAVADTFSLGSGMMTRSYHYSADSAGPFTWWWFGKPSASSTSTTDFIDTVGTTKAAGLRSFVLASLIWDATNTRWNAQETIFMPEKLPAGWWDHQTTVDTAFNAVTGSMNFSYYPDLHSSSTSIIPVNLLSSGDLQTVVYYIRWNAAQNTVQFSCPDPPANWPTDLTPANVDQAQVWVRPEKDSFGNWNWMAYTITAFKFH
jgi:hypothetical protein